MGLGAVLLRPLLLLASLCLALGGKPPFRLKGAALDHHRVLAAHVPRPQTRGSSEPPPCSAVADFARQAAEQAMADFNVTGLSLGVVCNHSVVFQGGFGHADVAKGVPATEHTLFQVASNTKAFTAMVALQMQEEGLLSLDAPVRDADPTWRTLDSYASASITPRDLMSHRTGLPRHDQVCTVCPQLFALN